MIKYVLASTTGLLMTGLLAIVSSGDANAQVEGAIDCDGTQKNFLVTTVRPGIFRFEVSDGNLFTYNARVNGNSLIFDTDYVIQTLCQERTSATNLQRYYSLLVGMVREASEDAQRECEAQNGADACRSYGRYVGSIRD